MRKRKLLSAVLALAMALTLLPATAFAAGSDDTGSETTSSGVKLSKTATLEDDGTYTINLEAYATGEVKTSTAGVPCDIVLVLDQSGSMDDDFSGNSTENSKNKRITALKNAATTFVESVQKNAVDYGVDHRVAIVGFASGSSKESSSAWSNTELLSTLNVVNYQNVNSDRYKDALVLANSDGSVNNRLTTAINRVAASGATYGNYGLEMAKGVLDNRTDTTYTKPDGTVADRKTIVVFFTDGYPGRYTTTDGFYEGAKDSTTYNNIDVANRTIAKAAELKTSGATIYSVGIFTDADPAADYNFKVTTENGKYYWDDNYTAYTTASQAANAYMHFVSSDYDNTCTSMTSSDRSTIVNKGYYLAASSSEDLTEVFETLSSNTTSTLCTLDANSILRDVMADGFDATSAEVTIQTANYQGNGNWGTAVTDNSITCTKTNDTIDIKGFSYKDNYVVEANTNSAATGKKLLVTIKGVIPTDSAVQDEVVDTNAATSGIYENSESETPVAEFPQPKTILTSKTFVLDYAKKAYLGDFGFKTVKSIVNTMRAVKDSDINVNGTYGNASFDSAKVYYTPKTINWNGYDSFYAFGETEDATIKAASANANGNLWSKVSVLPANNVYYEDDFVTTSDGSTIGITYYDDNWEVSGTSQNNRETADNDVHGWIDSKVDDTQDSDGSSHMTSKKTATASFTFTGTGVDIYSRTNTNSAKIYVKVSKLDERGTVVSNKLQIVDTKSASGEYYQIPTYTFSGEYGTYQVTLKVQNDAVDGAAYAYNIDGIRIYNPIRNLESTDGTVQNAYRNELGATFTEVRDLLMSGYTAFIDNMNDENGNPTGNPGVGDYTKSEIGKIAPAHEIYLSEGQSVVINASGADHYYIGLKAPAGTATAEVSSGDEQKETINITSASDLYYAVSPNNNGTIIIKNTGDNLLSITKLRTTINPNSTSQTSFGELDDETALAAYTAFSSYSMTTYSDEIVTDEELTKADSQEQGTVVIENPEPETGTVEAKEEQPVDNSWIQKMFNSFRKFFGRR